VALSALAALVVLLCYAAPGRAGESASTFQTQRATVHALRDCLGHLPPASRKLLALQFGLGGKTLPSIRSLAEAQGVSKQAIEAREAAAVAQLQTLASQGVCQAQAVTSPGAAAAPSSSPAVSTSVTASATASTTPAALAPTTPPGAASSSGGGHALEIVLAVLVALALVAGAVSWWRRRRDLPPLLVGQREAPRRRRFVRRPVLIALWPLFRYSLIRDAYVLRVIGQRFGPVLREDMRQLDLPIDHPDRRAGAPSEGEGDPAHAAAGVDLASPLPRLRGVTAEGEVDAAGGPPSAA